MKAYRVFLAALPALMAFVLVGCGPQPPSRTFSADELDKMADERLKAIADDTSLADADSFKKYFEHHSATPTIIMPKELGPWWSVKPAGDGYTVHITHIPNPLQAGATVESRLASERNWMKASIELSRQVLRHFEHRKVRSIRIALHTQLTGDTKYTEMFRATATQADRPKLDKATGPADAGTVFDPRGKKIAEVWTVELNRYPDLEYRPK